MSDLLKFSYDFFILSLCISEILFTSSAIYLHPRLGGDECLKCSLVLIISST